MFIPPSPPASPAPGPRHVCDADTPNAFAHYRASPAFTFHAYSPPASPPRLDDSIAPPALSTLRASRLSAPFPTFLYASEPPPVTARNKQRVRPSPAQLADLKSLYAVTAHPTREDREALGRKIGMRYQSVTNWFQNQRSTAKKRAATFTSDADAENMLREDPHDFADLEPEHEHEPEPEPEPELRPRHRTDPVRDIIAQARRPPHRQPTPPPPPHLHVLEIPPAPQQHQLPLPLSGSAIMPSTFPGRLPPAPRTTPAHSRAASPPLVASFQGAPAPHEPAPEHEHERAGPEAGGHRGKRSRPTPHQLAVLRALHTQTPSPSIEERTRVGNEIGMELGKVTNWFRNLRQTARKKERRAMELGARKRGPASESEERPLKRTRRQWLLDDEDDGASQGTGLDTSSTVGSEYDMGMDVDDVDGPHEHERDLSEQGTESDAAHEAVTPEPQHAHLLTARSAPPPEKDKGAASVDDAMLLLAFHGARA